MAHAGTHRRKRIGDCVLGVVMRVNAQMRAGDVLHHLFDDILDLVRQRAAIGVAQHDPARARFMRRARALQGVIAIGLEAVEEMLAIKNGLAPMLAHVFDRVRNAVEVLVQRAAQRHMHMVIPCLGHKRDRIRHALH